MLVALTTRSRTSSENAEARRIDSSSTDVSNSQKVSVPGLLS